MTTKRKKLITYSVVSGIITTSILIISAVWSCYGRLQESCDAYINAKIAEQTKPELNLIRSDIVYIKLLLENHCITQTGDSSEIVKTKKIMTYFYNNTK